jgi:hypothetical protein
LLPGGRARILVGMTPNLMRVSMVFGFAVLLLGGACGSVSPIGSTGSGGGGAGTTGSAGTTGGAGTTGAAGTNGGAGMTGRVPVNHRAAATVCSPDRPAGVCAAATNPSAPPQSLLCKEDADCGQGKNGRCLPMARVIGCACSYDGCFGDGDCAQTGGPCECRPAGGTTTAANVCKGGNCRTDEDCGAGGYCSPSFGSCGRYLGVVAYYCHTPKDKCVDDADCAGTAGADCRYNQVMGAWMCETTQCAG